MCLEYYLTPDLQPSRIYFYQCNRLFSQAETAHIPRKDSTRARFWKVQRKAGGSHTCFGVSQISCLQLCPAQHPAALALTHLVLNPWLSYWLFLYLEEKAGKLDIASLHLEVKPLCVSWAPLTLWVTKIQIFTSFYLVFRNLQEEDTQLSGTVLRLLYTSRPVSLSMLSVFRTSFAGYGMQWPPVLALWYLVIRELIQTCLLLFEAELRNRRNLYFP